MFRVSLKGILGHKLRLALTALAVTLGVSLVAGTLVLTDTINAAFTDLFGRVDQNVDAVVRAHATFSDNQSLNGGRDPIPESVLSQVSNVSGVRAAAGGVLGYAQIIGRNGKAIEPAGGAPTLGVSVSPVRQVDSVSTASGRLPTSSGDAVIDVKTAADNGIHVGDRVKLLFINGPGTFTVVGTIRYGNADSLANATLAAFDLRTAQHVMNRSGQFDEIRVVADPGASQTAVRDHINQALGGRYGIAHGAGCVGRIRGRVGAWLKLNSAARLPSAGSTSRTLGRLSGRPSVAGSMRSLPRKSSSMNFR